jgi:co-chaperonin GroES (HSP10)
MAEQLSENVPRPVRGKIVVKLVECNRMSKSGMVKSMAMAGGVAFGVVLAVGENVTQAKVGDFVHFDWILAKRLTGSDDLFHIIPEGAVYATEEADQVELVSDAIERVPALVLPGSGRVQ